jgi:Undecaprenyl-phosphate glucose phosphotransferase
MDPPPPIAPAPELRDRRGPMRPQQLASTRQRVDGAALSRLYLSIDAVAVGALAAVACVLANPAGVWSSPVGDVTPFFLGAAFMAAALSACGAYTFRPRETLAIHTMRLLLGLAVIGVMLAAYLFVAGPPVRVEHVAIGWFEVCAVCLGLLHLAWWIHVRGLRRAGRLTPNIVVVGATNNARQLIARALEGRQVAVLGIFDDRRDRAPDDILGVPVLGDTSALIDHKIMPYVDQVVITVTASARTRVRDLVERLRVLPNEITLFLDLEGGDAPEAQISRLIDLPLRRLSGHRMDDGKAYAKRIQDVALGCLALAAAAPFMAAVAFAIKLDSPGPVFFRQRRQGFNNEEIVVWKFRSMHHQLRDERAERQVETDDPRVTRIGKIIRRTSLDELPQLFNVLRGEMSLVGPRPHAPGMKTGDVESVRLVAEYAHRHRIKPGMTGWAAIHGSMGALETAEQVRRRVALDIEYIQRQSFWLDLYIMLMTVPRLIGEDGAAR